MTQIAVIVGSLRRDSYNRRLAQALEGLRSQRFEAALAVVSARS